MKKITLTSLTALVAVGIVSTPAYALPTYEPFSEYNNLIATSGATFYATSNGVALSSTAPAQGSSIGSVANAIDLGTNGLIDPSGEAWSAMYYCSSNYQSTASPLGTNIMHGLDVYVVSNTSIFTAANVGTLLPSTFPGCPAAGQSITNFVENPAQPVIWTNGAVPGFSMEPYLVGNSPVLTFSQDITRPASGTATKTLFVSYLFIDWQQGATGTGNEGRYLSFLAHSNLVEGATITAAQGGAYTNWDLFFNTFGTTTDPRYFSHGVLQKTLNVSMYLGPVDSSKGLAFTTTPFVETLATPVFVVGEYIMVSQTATNSGLRDTNIMWVNPTTSPNQFGGTAPYGGFTNFITNMPGDVGGMVLEDRVGNGASGGIGTNYIANLMLGTTWSYVTGGPEFTNQPAVTSITTNTGSTISLGASATAAGQSISAYQWLHVVGGVTNIVNNGPGGAGGSAFVSGATGTNLTLAGIANADTGIYLLQATASSTLYTLNSAAVTLTADPDITAQPQNTQTPVGGSVTYNITATTGTPPLSFQWQINGAPIFNGTQGDGSVVAITTNGSTCTLTINNAQNDENHDAITCAVTNGVPEGEISSSASLTIVPDPAITANPSPASQTVNYGATATFTASAETVGYAPLAYAWYFKGTMLVNGTQADNSTVSGASGTTGSSTLNTTLTLGNVSYLEDGNYVLWVTNNINGVATSTAGTLSVNDPIIITEPPATVEVGVGNNTTISVVAAGTGVSYQWSGPGVGGPDVSGANSATLTITGAQMTDAGSYSVVITGAGPNSPLTSTSANLTVETGPTAVTVTPGVLNQNVGSHLALLGTITGGSPEVHVFWQLNGTNLANGTQADNSSVSGASETLAGSGTSTLILSNLQVTDTGTYSLIASNGGGVVSNTGVVTVSNYVFLSTTNLVVTRVGDGNQALSGATGNTLYLDQYTIAGQYVSTIMVPDAGTNVLIVPGSGADWFNESYMTLSSNGGYLNFIGYFQQYPSGQTTVNAGGTGNPRTIGAVNALGVYVMAYTNQGIDNGGGMFVRDAYSTDGLTNFWVTGAAGSGAIKYVNAGTLGAGYATGTGIPAMSDTVNGPICLGLAGRNLVFSDSNIGDSNGLPGIVAGLPYPAVGLDIFAGAPEANPASGGATNMVYYGSPADFAFSPDLQTVYFCDAIPQNCSPSGCGQSYSGGIQRYDWSPTGNNGSTPGYLYSYTLQDGTTGPTATNGLRGLTVYFPPNISSWGSGVNGAVLYATTSEQTTNRIIMFTDNGLGSPATALASAGANQSFRGIRFGPALLPVTFTTALPAVTSTFAGATNTLTVAVTGDGPFSYQWESNSVDILGATSSSYTLANIQSGQNGVTYTVCVSDALSTNCSSTTLNVESGPPTLVFFGPGSLVETVGDHTAFTAVLQGSEPLFYQWATNGGNIPGATSSSLVLTNIAVSNSGTYTLTYSNLIGSNHVSATLLVTPSLQSLSSNNLIVARVSDGAEPLSDTLGNTLYLDQYTTSGGYSNTIMIPDNQATNLIVAGGPISGVNESFLNLSTNTNYLNFCGYDTNYPNTSSPPFTTAASSPPAGSVFRSIGAVDAFGHYTTAQVNESAFIASPYDIESAVSLDGLNEFWSTGFATAGGVKYLIPSTAGAAGGNYGAGGSGLGTRVVQIVKGNVVYTDLGVSPIGIYGFPGLPTLANPLTATAIITDAAGSPNDFAVSPDTTAFPPTTSTVYLADSSLAANGGGIQRYDWNGSGYALSYTLGTGSGYGATALAVNFSANATWGSSAIGAVIYATTAASSSNALIKIVDNGMSSAATVLVQTYTNELLRGVRFGPVINPPAIVIPPASQSAVVGQEVDFSVTATGSDISYQWQTNGTNIPGATGTSYSIFNVQPAANGLSYTVIVSNPAGQSVTNSPAAVLTVNPFSPTANTLPLVGWWILNDGPNGANSGTTAADSSSYADNGTLNNFADPSGFEWTNNALGSYSYALNFDNYDNALDNTVLVPDGGTAPQLNFSNNLAFTLATWIYPSNVTQGALIAKGYGNGGEQYAMDVSGGFFRVFVRNAAGTSTGIQSAVSPTPNVWQHVAATYDGYSQQLNLYVNGQLLLGPSNAPSSLLANVWPLSIGNRTSSSTSAYDLPLQGEMQDARIYNVALGQQDIQAIYASLVPPSGIQVYSNSTTLIPNGQVSPAISFGTIPQYQGAADAITFEVTNTGGGQLTVGPVTAPSGYTVTQPPSTIAVNGSGTFTVQLSATAAGTFSGNINIPNNAPGNPFTFAVTGTVIPVAKVVYATVPVTGQPSAPVLHFSGTAGVTYHVWTTSSIALEPVETKWILLGTGTFSGGADTFACPAGTGTQFYAITQP